MLEEQYKAKCPGHILMADAAYFEEGGKDLEDGDIIDYQPPPEFQLGILLERKWNPITDPPYLYMISLYFTTEQYLDRCLNLEAASWCGRSQQVINVENVRYRIQVDERQQTVETGEEGEWGLCQEYYSLNREEWELCAVHIGFIMPEQEAFDGMRNRIYSLFEEVYPVQSEELSGKEETVNTGKVKECISVKETLKELRNADHHEKVHHVQRCCEK